MKEKVISCALCASMFCASIGTLPVKAEDTPYFTHQNVVGNQTCYANDVAEKTITEIPNVLQGIRINQPVFRAYLGTEYAGRTVTVNQMLKDGTVIKSDEVTASNSGAAEFKHARNCEAVEISANNAVIASMGTELEYVNGVAVTSSPMSYQIYQRDKNDQAEITIKGKVSDASSVSVAVDGEAAETVTIEDNAFTYTKTLGTGLYDITVSSNEGEVATYTKVGVGDIWVAAGQSNMTDMGAITDGFNPETDDPINDNMHILFAEDCTWQQMTHPAGEGRFFKTGVRTSPVTSFAREIADAENVPVGIVQSSVGGTNMWQWFDGISNDAASGYLFNALKSCFDKMPSHNVAGILWYQGCNDTDKSNYAYDYKNLQQKAFDAMHGFFGEDTAIITTQLNDANQDTVYNEWSFVKDIQRQNETLYDNVYVVGTGELELGDTIHNSAVSNVKLGQKWAKVAKAVVYGDGSDTSYRNAQVDTATITGDKEITVTFKDTNGLKVATGTKRLAITNGVRNITLGDLTKTFQVRKQAKVNPVQGTGTPLTIASAQLQNDGKTVVITTEEDFAGLVAVDCMYGKRFNPSLVDAATDESVLSFYNVIAVDPNAPTVTEPDEYVATDTADLNNVTKAASSETMYANYWKSGDKNTTGYALMKFTLGNADLSKIASAKLAVYTKTIPTSRTGNTTISQIDTNWDNTASILTKNYEPIAEIKKINSDTASLFPIGNYSEIDIADFLRSYQGTEIGMGISTDYASDVTFAGVNSDNPPKLIIQEGKQVELTYTHDNKPCANINVTIETAGSNEYDTTTFKTDANGKLTLYLTEGKYKATTEKETYDVSGGKTHYYEPSSNIFVVTADVSEDYTLTAGEETLVENPTYTFGEAFDDIKPNGISSLDSTKIGNTGLKISATNKKGYSAVGVMNETTKTGTDLCPYGKGLVDNGYNDYYLFIGAGGSSNFTSELTFDNPIAAGKYIKITYAKPKVGNSNGSRDRSGSASNAGTLSVNGETVNVGTICEFDKWYTTTFKASAEVSKIDFSFNDWDGIAISRIEVTDSVDTMELTAEGNTTEAYIVDGAKVKYTAKTYNSITTLMGDDKVIARGTASDADGVTYSVNGYEGVSIDSTGSLSITSSAPAGTVTVSAECGGVRKELTLLLKTLGNASSVEINGSKLVGKGSTEKYAALPILEGVVLPPRATKWEIVGEVNGVSIEQDGTLTVSEDAKIGNVTIKATLTATGAQTAEVSDTMTVTVGKAAFVPYTIQGIFLKDGETDISKASGIEGIIINKTDESNGFSVVVEVFDENNRKIAEKTIALENLAKGVQEIKTDIAFSKAAFAKAYIIGKIPYEITKVVKNGAGIAEVEIVKNGNNTVSSAELIIAKYSDGALKGLSSKQVSLQQGTNTVSIDNVTVEDGASVKTMIWDSMSTMRPLAEPNTTLCAPGEEAAQNNETLILSDTEELTKGEYKNVPLVADWITGENSGLGMGAGIMAPTVAPYGVDPKLVDVTASITYSYGGDYEGATVDNALWYKTAAYDKGDTNNNNSIYARDGVDWEKQALPIGNGYMGAMLFGMPNKDQIQINEETFWAAGYRGVQKSVASNNVNKDMSEGINGYMSVGNVFVDFTDIPDNAKVKNYYRDLNLDDSVAHVRYEYDGKKYNREYFASYPREALVFRYTGDNLNFNVNPVSMHPGKVTVNDGEITIIGKLKDSEPYNAGGASVWNQESDLEYCTKIKVIADDGKVTDGYNSVNVKGATGVTIIVAAATDYDKDEFDVTANGKVQYKSVDGVQAAIDKATARINGTASMTYAELKAEHIADYKAQYDTVKFSLTDENEIYDKPTNELVSSYSNAMTAFSPNNTTDNFKITYDDTKYKALSHHLEELHYNYARYLMISSSRSNTMPANLQGKWCQSTAEIWGSCYCININMEMNYWFAGGANLLDSGKALIGWFNSQIPAGTVTAKNMYGVTPKSYKFENGTMTFTDSTDDKDDVFIMHTKQAIMGTTDMTGSTSIQSAGNTAWLMYNVWDLYQTSGDKELLRDELYPIMRKCANFYTQYLYTKERKTTTDTQTYPDGYYYTTWEGRSPEQGPNSEGIKYDLQLVAGMFDYTIAAAETLGVDADKVAAWKEIRNHLELPVELGDDNQVKEWKQEVKYNRDASGGAIGGDYHRHISHLVGLYPGNLINRDTPEWLDGAKIVLTNRGDGATGWSTSNKFLLWARTLEGDKALDLFRFQLAHRTYANLFDYHSPFQIDGNFGSAAGVMELLMQSQTDDKTIYILPALPKLWDKGEISGIKAKNGAEVSIKWNNGKATEFKITPVSDGDITIGYERNNALKMNGSGITLTNGKYTISNAKAGTTYTFTSVE